MYKLSLRLVLDGDWGVFDSKLGQFIRDLTFEYYTVTGRHQRVVY